MFGFFGADRTNGQVEVLFEDLAIEKEDRGEGLILGGGGDFIFWRGGCEMMRYRARD